MEHTRALDALAPFLALSKSATSPRAAADLVTRATSAPHVFVFAELLRTPNVQALRESKEFAGHLRLLEIFAWGTWGEYEESKSTLPGLTDAQTDKLRLLTLLTPPSPAPTTNGSGPDNTNGTNLELTPPSEPYTYASLQRALALPTPRALESLVTRAIYASLLTATLDPLHQTVSIHTVAPVRDLRPGGVPQLRQSLDDWAARCGDALEGVQREIEEVRWRARERRRWEREWRGEVERAAEARLQEGRGKAAVEGQEDEGVEAMEVESVARSPRKVGKRGGGWK